MTRRVGPFIVWLVSATVVLGAVAALALILIATNPANGPAALGSTPPSQPGPSSTPWLVSVAPGDLQMPEGSDCSACHVTTGGVIGVKPIPVVAHPIHGWTECTSCHASDRLVTTAPGHTGIHKDECIVCHRAASQPAPTPRHPTLPDSDCLACHGSIAPLPSSMVDRPRTLCWLCHHS